MPKYICFDIGGTDVKYSLADQDGNLLAPNVFSSENGSGKAILDGIERIVKKEKRIKGVAISAPGFVNPETGFLENGGAIPEFHRIPLKDILEEKLNLRVSVENDVNCVALGEKWKGNAKKDRDFMCMTIGTGVGGAIFIDNRLYRGHSFKAGEFGYMITHGVQDSAPNDSILSHIASVLSLRKHYAAMKELPLGEVTGLDVFNAYDDREEIAVGLVRQFYLTTAISIFNLSYIINPRKILIGGAISSRPSLISELKEQLVYLGLNPLDPVIDLCLLKNHAGMTGALYHHLYS
ncbi:ROK family protein [Metabacillus sp. RGM 3146]|uniref:ROK family protein n=1 Tax=Metabacillus sp. RGM 3146 TaxID=3401092 RepID=UPI003B9C456E